MQGMKIDSSWHDFITSQHWICRRFDNSSQLYEAEVYVKVRRPRGILHLMWWGRDYDEQQLLNEANAKGTFSRRPYRLNQSVDTTTEASIDALYHHFCAAKNLHPDELYNKAYQGRVESSSDTLVIRQLAEWQGLVYPAQWNDREVIELLHHLASINNHALVALILEAVPHIERRFYQ